MQEVLNRLGWRYKLYVPAVMAISAIFLLPPKLLQFFAGGATSLASIDAEQFVLLLGVFGCAVAFCLWIAIFLNNLAGEWLRLTVSIGLRRDSVQALHRTRLESLDSAHRGDWMTRVTSDLRNRVRFGTSNLQHVDQCPYRGQDVIFCQNVLIYFRQDTVSRILDQFVDRLNPGGLLVLGAGEAPNWKSDRVVRWLPGRLNAYRVC